MNQSGFPLRKWIWRVAAVLCFGPAGMLAILMATLAVYDKGSLAEIATWVFVAFGCFFVAIIFIVNLVRMYLNWRNSL